MTTAGVTQLSEVSQSSLVRSVLIPILYSQDLIDRELHDFDMGMGPIETRHSKKNSFKHHIEETKKTG